MLEIESLSEDDCLVLEVSARHAFKLGAYANAPHEGAPVPTHEGWLLAYAATRRALPRSWATAAFRVLGDDTAEGARVRGYLLTSGLHALRFDGDPDATAASA